jgi:hypothetical protein
MKLNSPLLSLSLLAIAALSSFPPIVQALPKNCGKTFTHDGQKHCVEIETASDEGAVLNVVSPLPEGQKGWEYRTYRVLVSCRNIQKPSKTITLLESHLVNGFGKMTYHSTNSVDLPTNSMGGQLGWQAHLATCRKN